MPCDFATITNPQTTYMAEYDFSLRIAEDIPGCIGYGIDGEVRGRLVDFGATWNCQHIRGLGTTVYINSYIVRAINYFNLVNSIGDVNTTPNITFIDMGAIENLQNDNDTDTIACPYFAQIPQLIRDRLFCTTEDNNFSEGYCVSVYYLYYADPGGDGWYWTVLWQDDVPPNNIFQNVRCNANYIYYTRSSTDGRLGGGGGTWVYGNTRQSCGGTPPYNHFVPLMYAHSCARMLTPAPYTNTKEDYETLTGLFMGDELWQSQFDIDTLKKMLLTRVL
jgi:hypothetical protein